MKVDLPFRRASAYLHSSRYSPSSRALGPRTTRSKYAIRIEDLEAKIEFRTKVADTVGDLLQEIRRVARDIISFIDIYPQVSPRQPSFPLADSDSVGLCMYSLNLSSKNFASRLLEELQRAR